MSVEIPGYNILRILGRGGMAKVYLAIQEVFEREVALKVMSKALAEDPNFGQRFFREAKIVSKLVHPNIVTVHDVGMHDGYCYLSMEYIDGQDLKHAVHSMDLRQKIRAVYDIAKALDYAGSKGYVHRDIKPENIMFHTSDGRAVLMDFGIARAAESDTQVTQAGTAIGTPHYMSPEQAKGKAVDHRSDIYSLGVVLFYSLAGHVPFDAESAVAIGIKHITEPIPLLPSMYDALQPIVDKMMSKDLSKRYQNAKELMADLDMIDIEVLEHTVGFASSVESEHTTLQNMSRAGTGQAESFEIEEDDFHEAPAAYDAYVHHEVDEIHDKTPILPWLIAGSFVLAVVGAFVHFKNPGLTQPLVDRVVSAVPSSAPVISKPNDDSIRAGKAGSDASRVDEGAVVSAEEADELQRLTPDVASDLAPALPEPLAKGQIDRSSAPGADVGATKPKQSTVATAEALAAQAQAEREKLASLKEKILQLEDSYAGDDIYLSQLVGAYREAMNIAPGDSAIDERFVQFRKKEIDTLYSYAKKNGSSPTLDKRVQQLQTLFPEIEKNVFSEIRASGKQRKKVMSLVLEAQAYFKQNNLTKPPGRNALDIYQKVLSLDPGNAEAEQGKKLISRKLSDAAQSKYQANNLASSLRSANKALSLDPKNTEAKKLAKQINAILGKQKKIATLLKNADQKIRKGQLFTPSGKGAFHDYQTVLKSDPQNTTAREGLDRVVDALSAKVWQLVGDEEFIQAKEMMRAPVREFGRNQRIKSLSLALDEIIGEKIMDLEPRVEGMLIQGEPIESLAERFSDDFDAERSIYLGFRYENFQTNTTVLQAVLMDGTKRIQIAQVPVVVNGAAGESTFRIDRPVEGFPSGSYSVEVRLGRETLNSTLFRVK
ncbi:MAG: protein kinase [Agarilytica sp.]